MTRTSILVSAFGVALTTVGFSASAFHGGPSALAPADSVVLTISAYGDARPSGALHTVTLSDAVDPLAPAVAQSKTPRWRAGSFLTKGDTIHTTLPAQLVLDRAHTELTLRAEGVTPNLRFELDLVDLSSDSLVRCSDEGRMFELGRLRDGGIVFRVDGTRPPPCKKQSRR